jgi:hypothetical protein
MEHEKIRMRQKQLRWADYNMDEEETSKAAMKNYKLHGEHNSRQDVLPSKKLRYEKQTKAQDSSR